jgi:arabinofuranosyltransferase
MEKSHRNLVIILVILLGILLISSAWVEDDAYITLRVVDNFVHGYGLSWNVGEHVQVYTHPFWMFLLIAGYAISKHSFLTTIGVSIVIALLGIIIFFFKVARTASAAIAGFALLLFSKAFIDYSVSGLENPLTHLLLLLFLLLFLRTDEFTDRYVFYLALLAGLSTLNRMDTILFYLPALLYIIWKQRSFRNLQLVALGFTPFILWELFSLVYYGFLLPNTFYAKLNTGISITALLQQGLVYFKNSLLWDPLTLPVIGASLGFAFFKAEHKQKFIAAGVLIYLFYTLYIGGDYMSGRFFSAPYFICATLLVIALSSVNRSFSFMATIACIILGSLAPFPAILLPSQTATELAIQANESVDGITDEKAYYFQSASLIHWRPGIIYPTDKMVHRGLRFREENKSVSVEGTIGFIGFFGGPQLHIIDGYALGDALLARLPVTRPEKWRISHFSRQIPAGYYETVESGQNRIENPDLAKYYEKLHLVISGNLWTRERWQAIWELNTGQYNYLLEKYLVSSNLGLSK